jgi:hypothetical protein
MGLNDALCLEDADRWLWLLIELALLSFRSNPPGPRELKLSSMWMKSLISEPGVRDNVSYDDRSTTILSDSPFSLGAALAWAWCRGRALSVPAS